MKNNYTFIMLLLIGNVIIFWSCSKTEVDIRSTPDAQGEAAIKDLPFGTVVTYTLWAAEIIDVGTVSIFKKTGSVTVSYATLYGWALRRTNIHADYEWQNIPMTGNGNPKLGHFQYKNEHDPVVNTFSCTLDEEYFGCFYIAVHAEVVNEIDQEQAWAEGLDFPGNQWAMYIYYVPPSIGKP